MLIGHSGFWDCLCSMAVSEGGSWLACTLLGWRGDRFREGHASPAPGLLCGRVF